MSRRWPWPYSVAVGDVGLMVRGGYVAKRVLSLANTVPDSAEYGTDDQYRERSFVFGRSLLGMGEAIQRTPGAVAPRYHYALNCWFAGGKRGRGPKWNGLAPSSTGSITDFAEALHGGSVTQFILAGRYVLRRTDDTSGGQVVSHDFGVGRTVTSWARYKAPGGTDSLYVTLDNGDLWTYNGAAWAGPAAAAGTWNGDAFLCCVVDNEMWIKDGANTVRKTTGDPTVGGSYSGQFTVGDGSQTISGLAALSNALFVFADNGKVFTLNSDGSSNDIRPELATTPATTNGSKPAADARGYLYFRHGSSWFRLTGIDGGTIEPIGPERLLSNTSEVAGAAQAFAWYGTYYGFFGLYNANNGASYLLQFGDWLPADDADGFQYAETFNGALVKWAGKQLTAMRVQWIGGVPRLYCGFTDGTCGWIRLPSNTPNPFSSQSGCEFSDGGTGSSEVYWPRHTMLKEADQKAYLHFQAMGSLTATETDTVAYRTSDGASWTSLDTAFTQSGQREEIEGNATGQFLDVRETFAASSSSTTPVVDSLVLREQLRPGLRLEWAFTVNGHARAARRDGATDRKTPDDIYEVCRRAADVPGSITLTLPDETVSSFHAVSFQFAMPPDNARYGSARDIQLSFVQYRTLETYGIVDRLGSLTVDELGSMTVDDLGVL